MGLAIWSIFKKEFGSFFGSLIGYLFIAIFFAATGVYMWVVPGFNVFDNGFADLEILFSTSPYLFVIFIPAVTMKSIAEERNKGTLELLLTKPISIDSILLGKFLACFTIVFFALLPTWIYYFSIYQLASPVGNVDSSGIIGSYIGMLLLACVFTACGILASSLTDNQIVSFIIGVFLCYFFYQGFDALATFGFDGDIKIIISKMGVMFHYEPISRGLLDSRDLFYFLFTTIMLVYFAKVVLLYQNRD
jgi:ABC-2 type transport system permease protein